MVVQTCLKRRRVVTALIGNLPREVLVANIEAAVRKHTSEPDACVQSRSMAAMALGGAGSSLESRYAGVAATVCSLELESEPSLPKASTQY